MSPNQENTKSQIKEFEPVSAEVDEIVKR